MLNRVEKDNIEHQPVRIGTLLVNEGFIRKADVDQAVEIQNTESRLAELSLGKLLVTKGLITRDQLQILLEHPELREDVGAFAVERGLMDRHQLAECRRRKPDRQPIDETLVATGYLSDDDFKAFLEQQLDSMKLCELAVRLGMISEPDLNRMVRMKRHQRTIGEILCDLSLITPLDLNSVLTKYRKHLRLGEILLKRGMVDAPTLEMALLEHESRAEPLGNLLVRKGILSRKQLFNALSAQFNIPFRELEEFQYTETQRDILTKIVGKTFSRQFEIVPLALESNTLTVAIASPENLKVVQALRSKRVDMRTQCVLVTDTTMKRLFTSLYADGRTLSVAPDTLPAIDPADIPTPETAPPTPSVPEVNQDKGPPAAEPLETVPEPIPPDPAPGTEEAATGAIPSTGDMPRDEEMAAAEHLVRLILKEALADGAEAIHMDQTPHGSSLRYRIGHKLHKPAEEWMETQLHTFVQPVMGAFKEMAGLDAEHATHPQDGAFRVYMAEQGATERSSVDFAVTTCPTLAGENMTIRLIQPCPGAPKLEELSHSQAVVSSLRRVMKDMAGMVLVAAPSGHDRTATLYGMLGQVHAPDTKTVTVEDPVFFSMPKVIQTQANTAAGVTCNALLRSALRLDPDVILTGNLPDAKSMALGFEAARKGILFLAATPGTDAANAVSRLSRQDIDPVWGLAGLKAVLAQRHVRKICDGCRHTYLPAPDEWQPLFDRFPGHLTFHKGAGCPDCGFSGFRGRMLISELLEISEPVSRALKHDITENDLRHLAIRSGMKTLIDDGLTKLAQTTISEIIDAVPPEAAEAFRCNRADAVKAVSAPGNDVEYKLTLSAEKFLKSDIQRLHHAYEDLVAQTGRRDHRSDYASFESFIKTQFRSISRRHRTGRVAFYVQHRNGGVLLSAIPEP